MLVYIQVTYYLYLLPVVDRPVDRRFQGEMGAMSSTASCAVRLEYSGVPGTSTRSMRLEKAWLGSQSGNIDTKRPQLEAYDRDSQTSKSFRAV